MSTRGFWTHAQGANRAVHQPGVPTGMTLPDLPGALCAQVDPELWFPERGESSEEAKAICRRCPERLPCLSWALEANEEFGVWGGLTAEERGQLHRRKQADPETYDKGSESA